MQFLFVVELIEQLKKLDTKTLKQIEFMDDDLIEQLRAVEVKDGKIVGMAELAKKRPEIGMMVSLDHSIYFHNARDFRADEWMCTESQTPWAGEGRGFVMQRIFSKDGKLIASCTQEVGPNSDLCAHCHHR